MATTLIITKEPSGIWKHTFSDIPENITSKLYCKTDGDYFRYVEISGKQRARVRYSDITVIAEGSTFTFSSSLQLMTKLKELEYIGFNEGGGGNGWSPVIQPPLENGQVLIYDSNVGGWTNQDLNVIGSNQLLQSGTITINNIDEEIELSVGFISRINGVNYANSNIVTFPLVYANEEMYRSDIIVMRPNTSSVFEYIQGSENAEYGIPPLVPDNRVLVTTLHFYGESVDNSLPFTGEEFIKKETDFNLIENPTTGYANIGETIRTIELSGVSSILNDEFLGFNTPTLFDITHDYIVTIKNATDKTLTIITNDSGADLPIILPNSQPSREFQIGEVLTFKIWEDLTYFELISSSIGGGGSSDLTLSEVLANGNIMDDQINYDATDTIDLGLFSKTTGDVDIEGVYLTTFTDPSGETFRPAIVRVELLGGVSKRYFIMGYQLSQGGMPTMKYIETDDNEDVVNATEVHLGDNFFYVKGDRDLGFQGIRMHDDYSENYTDRCLIDKGYLLDSSDKIKVNFLPNSVMELKGQWNALTNTPTLVNGVGNPGDVYEVTAEGSQNFGGSVTYNFSVGDFVVYGADNKWYRSPNTYPTKEVVSVSSNLTLNSTHNGKTLRFTDTLTVTVPSGLAMNFEVFLDNDTVLNNVTFDMSAITTVLAPSGNILVGGGTGYLTMTTATKVSLKGDFID